MARLAASTQRSDSMSSDDHRSTKRGGPSRFSTCVGYRYLVRRRRRIGTPSVTRGMIVKDLATCPVYTITRARPEDLAALPAIELAAASLLAGHAPEPVLNETTSEDVLKAAQARGQLWVALADDGPVGFA